MHESSCSACLTCGYFYFSPPCQPTLTCGSLRLRLDRLRPGMRALGHQALNARLPGADEVEARGAEVGGLRG